MRGLGSERLSPLRAESGIAVTSVKPRFSEKRAKSATMPSNTVCAVIDEVDLVHRQHDVADAEQRGDGGVAVSLRQQSLARIHQQDGEVGT